MVKRPNVSGLEVLTKTKVLTPTVFVVIVFTISLGLLASLMAVLPANMSQNYQMASVAGAFVSLPSIGLNIGENNSYAPSQMFIDPMKSVRPWMTMSASNPWSWDTGFANQIAKDSNGYPLQIPAAVVGSSESQIVFTIVRDNLEGRYSAGTYTVYFDGSGILNFRGDAGYKDCSVSGCTISVTPTNAGIQMLIMSSTPGNYVKNIRLITPGYTKESVADLIFNPTFTSRMGSASTLRFMDALKTNNSNLSSWSNRTLPGYYTQALDTGISIEYLISLANKTNKDPWFNIPVMADDAYITAMATLIKQNLNSERKVYIEYSNEIWNSGFAQDDYCLSQAQKLWPALASSNSFAAIMKYQAYRSAQIFKIFQNVYGADSGKVVRVMAAQYGNYGTYSLLLDAIKDTTVNPYYPTVKADILAGAAYYGDDVGDTFCSSGQADAVTVAQIVSAVENSTQVRDSARIVASSTAIANSYGVPFVAYEGGLSLGTANCKSNVNFIKKLNDAARDPKMFNIQTTMFNNWFNSGGGLYNIYEYIQKYGQYGFYGTLEYVDQSIATAPIYRAVIEKMNNLSGGITCTPKTCAQLGKTCGSQADGCGNTLSCGSCTTGKTCNTNGTCETLACTENWTCTDWSICSNSTQTRTCSDANFCGTTSTKPIISQACTVATPVCGNGIIEGTEQCDGSALAGQTCITKGYLGGTLTCSNCQFNTTKCNNTCTTVAQCTTKFGSLYKYCRSGKCCKRVLFGYSCK